MTVKEQITAFLASLPDGKSAEMEQLHKLVVQADPTVRLWFEDGKNDAGKTVANPNIGYGFQILKYANGKTREFFRIGISSNTTGISVYVLGLEDKKFLVTTYGKRLGKASVTGYCIKFKSVKDIDLAVLDEVMRYALSLKSD